MKDYKALAAALRRRIRESSTHVSMGATLAKEIVEALEEANHAAGGTTKPEGPEAGHGEE